MTTMSKVSSVVIVFAIVCRLRAADSGAGESDNRVTLWYDQPASQWSEAIPIGNGRMGAMVFGRPADEVLYLNEDTVWSGGPHDYTNVGSRQYLGELRRLMRDEKYEEAAIFGADHMLGVPPRQQVYESLGKLHLKFPGHESYTDYRRQLDMSQGVVKVRYQVGDAKHSRQILASRPDQVIAIRLECDRPGRSSTECTLISGGGKRIGESRQTGCLKMCAAERTPRSPRRSSFSTHATSRSQAHGQGRSL